MVEMKRGSWVYRVWLWWGRRYWTVFGREIAPPDWPWRLRCLFRGHDSVWDQCMKPEHQYCIVCTTPTPHALPSTQKGDRPT